MQEDNAMEWNISFDEAEFGWLHHDVQTDFWKFRVDCTDSLTDEEIRRVSDAMVKAGACEMIRVKTERSNNGSNGHG